MPHSQFSRHVLVTGAAGALGSGMVSKYKAEGAQVSAFARKLPEGVEKLSSGLGRDENGTLWAAVDLTKSGAIADALGLLVQEVGKPVEVLIHCAGGFRYGALADASIADIDFLIDANLRSTFYLLHEVLPAMRSQKFGRILLISSKTTLEPVGNMAPYLATKAALNALVLSIANEVKSEGIKINALLPSIIDTPANREAMSNLDFSKWVSVTELADWAFSLTSKLGDPVTGALIPVTGEV